MNGVTALLKAIVSGVLRRIRRGESEASVRPRRLLRRAVGRKQRADEVRLCHWCRVHSAYHGTCVFQKVRTHVSKVDACQKMSRPSSWFSTAIFSRSQDRLTILLTPNCRAFVEVSSDQISCGEMTRWLFFFDRSLIGMFEAEEVSVRG